jgi:hypothetical protein
MLPYIFHSMTPHEQQMFVRFAMRMTALACKVMITQLILEAQQ